MWQALRNYFTKHLILINEELELQLEQERLLVSAKNQHIVDLQAQISVLEVDRNLFRDYLFKKVGLIIEDTQPGPTNFDPIKGTTSWSGLRAKIEKRASVISADEIIKSQQEVEEKIKAGLLSPNPINGVSKDAS